MKLFRCISVILFCLCCLAGYGQNVIDITDGKEDFVLNPYAFLYKGNAGLNDVELVSNAPKSDFTRNDRYQEIEYGFYKTHGWCKFTIKNVSDNTNWILKVHQARVDSVQLYFQREGQSLEKFPLTGHFQDIRLRPFYSLHFAYQIAIARNETVTFYLYTQREFGRHATIISLQKENFFRNYEHLFSISISLICGMIILAALVGLVLFFFVFDKIYLFYSIYCLIFFILILANTGLINAYMSGTAYQSVINTFNTVFYYWIVGWHILFTILLLNIKSYYKKVYYFGYVSGILICAAALILMVPQMPFSIRWWIIYFSYFIVFFFDAYILLALLIGVIKKEQAVYFYLAGFLVTIIVASLLMLADLQVIDGINQNTDLYFFIPLVEILFMVLGLGFRFSASIKDSLKAQLALNKTQNQIITIQEDERKRIAQDLHDDVGNSLAAIKHMLVQKRDNSVIENEIDKIIEDIRSISHNLMPVDFQEYALTNIVKHTVEKLHGHSSINFDYDSTGETVKMNPFTELVIYRIINELINNTIKHSNASTALIQLIYQKESLIVMVEDNGVGLKKPTEYDHGLGLKSIQLRAHHIRAQLNIESDDKGTLVILEIPYENL